MDIPNFMYDDGLIETISARFNLRRPNRLAFEAAVKALAGDVDPTEPLVLSLATGVGKTYIMAALVEYFREIGISDAIIVTPSSIVQSKTVANFSPGSGKFIGGALTPPKVITPDNYDSFSVQPDTFSFFGQHTDPVQLFVLNVQQLTRNATQLPSERELSGNLKRYLQEKKNLIVLADEHHLYSVKAKAFREGIMDLDPAAIVGLTASADDGDDIRYRYTLREAITDGYVKRPVIAFRRGGYGDHEEEQQLRDSIALLKVKEREFETYRATEPSAPGIRPVLFVQCADVDHASATAQLLRTSEYFGSERAILQVDNKHDDAETLKLLTAIDSASSPVRAVVSVNKLKEGWDVKNVAVMVTLRAMASEVLTQQTLGRGLRLPFGKITGIPHVDQLDVIAHESFSRMLSNEQVLKEFGLDAINTEPKSLQPTGDEAAQVSPTEHQDDGNLLTPTTADNGLTQTAHPDIALPSNGQDTSGHIIDGGVGIVEFGASDEITAPPELKITTITVNEAFKSTEFLFPSTKMTLAEKPIDLTDSIKDHHIRTAAESVRDSRTVLQRQAIEFTSRRLRPLPTEDVDVESIHVDTEQVRLGLADELVQTRIFDSTRSNILYVHEGLVPDFMRETGISAWSIRSVASATEALRSLLASVVQAHRRSLEEEILLVPKKLPIRSSYTLPPGEATLQLLPADAKSEQFEKYRHYEPWQRGLFRAASFDSFSAEYRIAAMLDRSPAIIWWKRLYGNDEAGIAYTTTNNYYPDFVALDKDGRHWIIEGKAENKRNDQVVQAKLDATQTALTKARFDERFGGALWGYAIAFESDVGRADSWHSLIASVRTVTA